MMKKKPNERGAGRKPKFTVPYKIMLVPEPIVLEVEAMSVKYLTKKKDESKL